MRTTILTLSLLAACSPGVSVTSDDPADQGAVERSTAHLEGRAAANAEISVYHGDALVSTDTATADADGRYDVEVDVGSGGMTELVVRSDDGGSVLVTSDVEAGTTVQVATMDDETTTEAELFAAFSAYGDADHADAVVLRALVTADVAASWDAEPVEAGVRAAIDAWLSAGGDDEISVLASIESSADAASCASGASASVEASAVADAWGDCEHSAVDISFLAHAAAEASAHAADDDATLGALSDLRAELMAEVIADYSDDIDVDTEDGDILGDLSGSVDLSAAIDAAFDDYSASVLTDLSVAFDADAEACVASAASVAAAARADLVADIAACGSGDEVASAMASYRSAVESEVYAELSRCDAMDDVEARAVTGILAQLYAAHTK